MKESRCDAIPGTFRVIEEFACTRDRREDEEVGWSMHPVSPDGVGWQIHDSSKDYKTVWKRWILVPVKETKE
jgi:hypothetical protein